MKSLQRFSALGLTLLLASGAAHAQTSARNQAQVAPAATAAANAAHAVSAPSQAAILFAKPVILRGTLGDQQIQMQLRPKEEFEGGVEGQYFAFGQSQQVLLAGEVADDQLFMEESVNGRDVSGDWVGVYKDGVLSGEWQSAAGDSRNFRLEVLPVPQVPATPTTAAKPAGKPEAKSAARQAAKPVPPRKAVDQQK